MFVASTEKRATKTKKNMKDRNIRTEHQTMYSGLSDVLLFHLGYTS